MGGFGTTIIVGSLLFTGTSSKYVARTTINQGTTLWNGGVVYQVDDTLFENSPNGTIIVNNCLPQHHTHTHTAILK